MNRGSGPTRHSILVDHSMTHDRSSPKTSKVNKAKGMTSGRTYTSKYRGVHQTFPTKRWEAQFRSVCSSLCGMKDTRADAAVSVNRLMQIRALSRSTGVLEAVGIITGHIKFQLSKSSRLRQRKAHWCSPCLCEAWGCLRWEAGFDTRQLFGIQAQWEADLPGVL